MDGERGRVVDSNAMKKIITWKSDYNSIPIVIIDMFNKKKKLSE